MPGADTLFAFKKMIMQKCTKCRSLSIITKRTFCRVIYPTVRGSGGKGLISPQNVLFCDYGRIYPLVHFGIIIFVISKANNVSAPGTGPPGGKISIYDQKSFRPIFFIII